MRGIDAFRFKDLEFVVRFRGKGKKFWDGLRPSRTYLHRDHKPSLLEGRRELPRRFPIKKQVLEFGKLHERILFEG